MTITRQGRKNRISWQGQFASLLVLLTLGDFAECGINGSPRIFISADMEGVAGVVTEQQLSESGSEYEQFRRIMTDEVLAAIDGARRAGAGDIVVADSHGNQQNILIDRLPKDVKLIRGGPRPLSMMEGIQGGHFDGAIFVGYHASASSKSGVRAHTKSSSRLSSISINGVPASEGLINAAIAGDFDVPVILVTGDNEAVSELSAAIGDIETAVVKRAISFHAAESLTPGAAQELIRDKAFAAVEKLDQFRAYAVKEPVMVEIMFHYYRPAEILSWLPFVERAGARSIRYEAKTMVEAAELMSFILAYDSRLMP